MSFAEIRGRADYTGRLERLNAYELCSKNCLPPPPPPPHLPAIGLKDTTMTLHIALTHKSIASLYSSIKTTVPRAPLAYQFVQVLVEFVTSIYLHHTIQNATELKIYTVEHVKNRYESL